MRALVAANRALALKPELPEALFNRALVLSALRTDGARAAWQTVIKSERDPAWAREAAARTSSAP
jgi:hypothetical protein